MSTITKLSPEVTQYYKNITSPIDANARITNRYTSMNSIKGAHELHKENSRDEQGVWKDKVLDGLPMIHAIATHL